MRYSRPLAGSTANMATRERLRKQKFTAAELDVLLKEVTKQEDLICGLQGNRLSTQKKYRIWSEITDRVCATSGIHRSIDEVKRRWQDLRRRRRDRMADTQHYGPHGVPSPSLNLSVIDTSLLDSPNVHTGVKVEEKKGTPCSLPEDAFPDTGTSPPEVCVQPHRNRTPDDSLHFDETPDQEQPGVSIKAEPNCRFTSLEQQLLEAQREQTAVLRDGFRSLARQNRLMYRELCETSRNVARIASRLGRKSEGALDVAEELLGVQHRISQSIDATTCLQERMVDMLATQQERSVFSPQAASYRDSRSQEEGSAWQPDP